MSKRLFLLAFLIFVVACAYLPSAGSTRPKCDVILATPFRNHVGKSVNLDAVFAIAENSYGVRRKDVKVTHEQSQQNWSAEWLTHGIRTIVWVQNGVVSRVILLPEKTHITAGQVIECVGSQPKWYWAAYGPALPEQLGVRYSFEMWFPDIGLYVNKRGRAYSAKGLPDLSSHITIDDLIIVEPGSLKVVHDRIFYGLPFDQQPSVLRPRPWPGDWANVFFIEERNYASW